MSKRGFAAMILFPAVLCIAVVGCGRRADTVVVGSKNFTEQVILGEMIALMIEAETHLKVDRRLNLAGTFVCFTALKNGDIDLYPEYTGTGLIAILKKKGLSYGKDKVYGEVKDEFRKKYDLVWLKPFGFNNTYTITMRMDQAKRLAIEKISDLKKHEETLRPCFNHEFLERPDGYRGLCRRYNLHFRNEPKEVDSGLMYRAIAEKQVDLICGFATDGRIPAFNLVMLRDNLHFFPPYYAAPLVRADTLKKYPELENILNKLGGFITDEDMLEMNYKVDQKGIDARKVARDFLIEKKLLELDPPGPAVRKTRPADSILETRPTFNRGAWISAANSGDILSPE